MDERKLATCDAKDGSRSDTRPLPALGLCTTGRPPLVIIIVEAHLSPEADRPEGLPHAPFPLVDLHWIGTLQGKRAFEGWALGRGHLSMTINRGRL